MVKNTLPYVVGSYGAALAIIGILSLTTFFRYRAARRRLAAVEPRGRGESGSAAS
ncbi:MULTISPECIES: heme exporter protein CcmD [Acidocellaceae]|jgi:heme exporter protein CcmD|uniref:heme exporter protein CcmD n=1 Tax=Acidocellaceae TaxID=3385905 RepID=UPI000BCC2464|nr:MULTISPECIES: heme exporter protein CcmD [Acetobacteraceae]OYV55577.1 MAG: heme exporter protein CcmD [Acidiphilium sp. 20-67-58]OYV81774.1 MAG: heme exporter protein CcmD [Acidiphilium sp. 21-68-69]HQT60164.1 heme exporter protein CcmD [Acidiphilium sp.]HQU10534.1 heme exporter protein CcmD [Acidiphilium sp.]